MTWNFGGFFAMGCEKWVRWVGWFGFVVWLGGAMGVAVAYLLHGTFITSLPVRKWVGGSVVQRLGGAA